MESGKSKGKSESEWKPMSPFGNFSTRSQPWATSTRLPHRGIQSVSMPCRIAEYPLFNLHRQPTHAIFSVKALRGRRQAMIRWGILHKVKHTAQAHNFAPSRNYHQGAARSPRHVTLFRLSRPIRAQILSRELSRFIPSAPFYRLKLNVVP